MLYLRSFYDGGNMIISTNVPIGQSTGINSLNGLDQQLASGKRVNSAADDAAGLQIIDRLLAQEAGFNQAIRNANDGISYSQVAEGTLSSVNDATQRIRELSIQAGNGALTDTDRQALQDEVVQLQSQISEGFNNATFGGAALFNAENVSFQIGADANQTAQVQLQSNSVSAALAGIDISTAAGAQAAIDVADQSLGTINQERAELGAFQNALESSVRNLATNEENLAASRSRIQDADFAAIASERVSQQITSDAQIALRGQANRSAESVLNLL